MKTIEAMSSFPNARLQMSVHTAEKEGTKTNREPLRQEFQHKVVKMLQLHNGLADLVKFIAYLCLRPKSRDLLL